MTFSLRLFGGASIEGADGPLSGRATQRHRLALLALLATSDRGGRSRDKVAAYLWPESDEERARRSLSDSVYRVNKALGDDTVFTVGDELRLDGSRLPSDVAAFRQAWEREDWQEATAAYTGPLLDGFHLSKAPEFDRWLDAERDRLSRMYGEALEQLAARRSAEGDLAGAAAVWSRRAAHDPYDSRVVVRLMEALDAAGNRAGALQQARIHAQLLEAEFGTLPDPEVRALEERLRQPAVAESAAQVPRVDVVPVEARPAAVPEREIVREKAAERPPPAVPSSRRRSRKLPFRPIPGARVLAMGLLVAAGAWWAWGRGASGPRGAPPGLAVLPFESLSSDPDNRFFAEGVAADILTNLSRFRDLRVIARPSVAQFLDSDQPVSDVARALGVRYLLQGSVRRADGAVRISAHLVDARSNTQIWAQTYDRRLEDVFAVQSDIAKRVAGALELELAPEVEAGFDRPPTEDLVAYNLYLQGRYFWHRRTEDGLLRSAEFFGDAVGRDSGYARAWAGLADAYSVLAFYDYLPPAEAYPTAKDAALRALEIDPSLAEAHASLGYITLYHDWDARTAETEFRRAIELNPSYSVGHQWYANLLVATGRFDEADREMSRAREVNPLSLIANLALGWVYYYAGRYEEAVLHCDLGLEMDADWDLALMWRGMALEELGRTEEALASLQGSVDASGGSGITRAALAHALAGSGAVDEARDLLARLVADTEGGRYQPSFEIAKVHVALGAHDDAIQWLGRALEERSHSMVFLEVDPQLAPLRGEPGFRRLVERVGLEG